MNGPLAELVDAPVQGPEGELYTANLTIHGGEVVVVPDQETQGRMRLLRIILGIDRLPTGHVALFGQDVNSLGRNGLNKARSRCAVLPAKTQMVSNLDVYSNVALPMRYHHATDEAVIRAKVMASLERLGLERYASHRPVSLTADQQRFVGLARALCSMPELFVIEDPHEGFNDTQSERASQIFKELLHHGTGILVSLTQSHSDKLEALPNARIEPLDTTPTAIYRLQSRELQ
jgi:ABC-type ATPase involved in cell division